LVYRLGSLGDTVVSLPCLHRIAQSFPRAERRLLTNVPVSAKAPAAAAVLGDSGLIHGYIDYPVGMRGPKEVLAVWRAVRSFRPQVLIYLSPLRGPRSAQRDRIFFRLCGIPELIGFPQSRQDSRHQPIPGTADFQPEAKRLAESIRSLGPIQLDDPSSWDLRLAPAEVHRARALLAGLGSGPVLAACLGTKIQSKDWGEANWTALLARLAAHLPDHQLLLVGAPEEAALSDRAALAWKGRSLNLCGLASPRESAAAIRAATLFLGQDSGPMHLAAAVGVPCVAIFSARILPRIWFPYGTQHSVIFHRTDCAGCGLDTCLVEKKKCILSITVDEVFAAALNQLNRSAQPKSSARPAARPIASSASNRSSTESP
jgi:ADP-heptose:LPS heptosyltransferase